MAGSRTERVHWRQAAARRQRTSQLAAAYIAAMHDREHEPYSQRACLQQAKDGCRQAQVAVHLQQASGQAVSDSHSAGRFATFCLRSTTSQPSQPLAHLEAAVPAAGDGKAQPESN